MAITAAVPNSYKADLLAAVHAAGDVYKIALYTSSATLDKTTTAYTATGEVTGTGYTAGGKTLTGYAAASGSDVAWIDWADPVWTTATFTARGAIIYNSSKSNKILGIWDFGLDVTSTGSDFTLTLPAAAFNTAVIRIS
jgi:hypothetical protein